MDKSTILRTMETEMAEIKATIIADNIISPLGFTSTENYASVKAGNTALMRYEGKWNIPTAFVGSFTDRNKVLEECGKEGIRGTYTYFEKIAILSISKALSQCSIDVASPHTLFILSTTKGNVDIMRANEENVSADRVMLGVAAKAIADYFGNRNQPIVVSNACTSGICAQITAKRLLQLRLYDNIIVCGTEILSPFIVSGFHSLMALSDEECRPFDEERNGINLGEAAATIIYGNITTDANPWIAEKGIVRNDAHHISNPSQTAEGCYNCLESIIKAYRTDDIAFINAHGTATLYNDETEAKAIDRAELLSVPVNSLKGYFGHTMGAAGVLETIISMRAIDDNTVLGTRGFNNNGVSKPLKVSSKNSGTNKKAFIKLISGFGGCNAAMLFRKEETQI